jgi:hypothetical protein
MKKERVTEHTEGPRQWIQEFLRKKNKTNISICSDTMSTEQIQRVVEFTSSFSGREISKLMIAVQGALIGAEESILTPKMLDDIVLQKVEDHKEKRKMTGIIDTFPQCNDAGTSVDGDKTF